MDLKEIRAGERIKKGLSLLREEELWMVDDEARFFLDDKLEYADR